MATTMKAALETVKGKISVREINNPSRSALEWGEEGEDHINISLSSNAEIGRMISHQYKCDINHPFLGKFSNMEALWHYVRSVEKDDRLRTMSGRSLKTFSKKLRYRVVGNFRAIIMDSNYIKIKNNKRMRQLMVESELPFECYYNNQAGVRIRPNYFKWLVAGFEEIRSALKEEREPNLEFLKDKRDRGVYDFVYQNMKTMPKLSDSDEAAGDEVSDEKTELDEISSEAKIRGSDEEEVSVSTTDEPVDSGLVNTTATHGDWTMTHTAAEPL